MNALAGQRMLPEIVEAVYDSVTDGALWPRTLGSICELCEGCLAMLAVVDTGGGTLRMSETCGDPALLKPLMHEYGSKVPFYAALPRMEMILTPMRTKIGRISFISSVTPLFDISSTTSSLRTMPRSP